MIGMHAGIAAASEPPLPVRDPYAVEAGPLLPRNLGEAIDAFAASDVFRRAMGDEVVEYLVRLKRSEWQRFLSAVTDWEQQEYFDTF